MKRLIGALKAKLHRPKVPPVVDEPGRSGLPEDVSMPDIYAEKPVAVAPKLEFVAAPGANKSIGFNPYDTAVLQKKK